MSEIQWEEGAPLYRQIRRRVENEIIEGALAEGGALPSVRQMASTLSVNPLTVMKAYQELLDEGLIEKRRGIGMHVAPGAHRKLLSSARQAFLGQEWPRVLAKLKQLGFDPAHMPS